MFGNILAVTRSAPVAATVPVPQTWSVGRRAGLFRPQVRPSRRRDLLQSTIMCDFIALAHLNT
jgi:hypothetical protein